MPYPYDSCRAIHHLCAVDAGLCRIIKTIGDFALPLEHFRHPFEALARAIVFQQLSGASASAIYKRLLTLSRRGHPSPKKILSTSDEALRELGLSRAKTKYIKDLAQHTLAGTVPARDQLDALSDADIITRLTQVKGIGTWSVQMLLIGYLARPDVLPVSDLGIRKGLQYTRKLSELPSEKHVNEDGEKWRPYRSVASWYLWQASYL